MAQGNQANTNCVLIINGVAAAYTARGDNNSTLGFSLCSTLSAGMVCSFAIDVNGTITNLTAYVLYRPTNTKIINNVVDIGTSLELLSDTNIISKANNDLLTYNSTSQRWENKPLTSV